MELKITKQKPEWNNSHKSDKKCLVVEFPNCISKTTKKSFKWLPKYSEIEEIIKKMREIENESWSGNRANEK